MSKSMFYHISEAGKLTHIPTVDEALAAAKDGGTVWLHYFQTTVEELSSLIDPLGLHPLAIEDCFDENEIPKIEDFPRNTFILFNTFDYSNRELSIGEIDLFIGDNFLVTVSQRNSENRQPLDDIEHIVETNLQNARHGPSFLMHVILDYVVDQKFSAIETLEDDMDTVEGAMLVDASSFNPAELIRFRRYLLSLRKSLFHEREILVKICRKDCPFITEKAIFHYRDIYDHLVGFFELTEILPGYRHQPHGNVLVDAEQPDDQSCQPDKHDRQTADDHHYDLYAAHAPGWNRWDVRMVYDDWA